jgi:hypothetical protein
LRRRPGRGRHLHPRPGGHKHPRLSPQHCANGRRLHLCSCPNPRNIAQVPRLPWHDRAGLQRCRSVDREFPQEGPRTSRSRTCRKTQSGLAREHVPRWQRMLVTT